MNNRIALTQTELFALTDRELRDAFDFNGGTAEYRLSLQAELEQRGFEILNPVRATEGDEILATVLLQNAAERAERAALRIEELRTDLAAAEAELAAAQRLERQRGRISAAIAASRA